MNNKLQIASIDDSLQTWQVSYPYPSAVTILRSTSNDDFFSKIEAELQ